MEGKYEVGKEERKEGGMEGRRKRGMERRREGKREKGKHRHHLAQELCVFLLTEKNKYLITSSAEIQTCPSPEPDCGKVPVFRVTQLFKAINPQELIFKPYIFSVT